MATVSGNALLAQALKAQGAEVLFHLMGGPMLGAMNECASRGLRAVDVRHEQAAAMMAHAWSRARGTVGFCVACSGPGTLNLTTGIANAYVDCAPVLAIGGSTPLFQHFKQAFQETDQVAVMRPITRWAARVLDARRIPEYVGMAVRYATGDPPGPVYLDLPGDVLYDEVPEEDVVWNSSSHTSARPFGDPEDVKRAVDMVQAAERPVLLVGSGVLWSEAWGELRRFAEATQIPCFVTPQARGVLPDDHRLLFLGGRSIAFSEGDLFLVVGTRLNVVNSFGSPPRFSADARFIQIDRDRTTLGLNRSIDLGIAGDVRAVLGQLSTEFEARPTHLDHQGWNDKLRASASASAAKLQMAAASDSVPIHPLRLCGEVSKLLDRDCIVVVDGHETLNFARQTIPAFLPRHRLDSGPYGCMGVGIPFGIAAKLAHPTKQVVVLTGDGAFGLNGMELHTAARQELKITFIVSNNGGWTALEGQVGRDLGTPRYDQLAASLGLHAEHVERPEDLAPALSRAFAADRSSCVNVITDPQARSQTHAFTSYSRRGSAPAYF